MPVIPVDKGVDKKIIIGKGGARKRRGTRGRWPTKKLDPMGNMPRRQAECA
jgi:GTPase Era involved in 16S rRNA processing